VAVAAYVTTQARLKLFEYVSELGSLFCTVIQVIFIQNVNDPPKVTTGDY